MIKDSRYYYGMGMESYEIRNFEKAIEYFLQSLELKEHFKTFELLYRCYLEIGNYKNSRGCIEKAYSLNNNNDKVAVEFASVLLNENNLEGAEKIIQEVIKRNPTYGPAKKLIDDIQRL